MTVGRELLAQTVALAGGRLVGRVRLQKVMYLLTKKGLGGPFRFSYHYYGPFSREVDDAIPAAKAFHNLKEEIDRRATDGLPFSVFTTDAEPPAALGDLPTDAAKADLAQMIAVPSTVIEIAATIHWLRAEEKVEDWRAELRLRKGAKASEVRVRDALDLLRRLGFEAEAA